MNMLRPTPVLCEVQTPKIAGLYGYSPFCEKVHRALLYGGIAYTRNEGKHPGAFKHLNPLGKVPVLQVGEQVISDSTDILRWAVEEAGVDLLPYDEQATNAEAWCWEEFADTTLNGFLSAARWADDENWQRTREAFFGGIPWPIRGMIAKKMRGNIVANLQHREVWTIKGDCWARFARTLEQMEQRAPREGFWLGASLSVADVGLFAHLRSFFTPLTPHQSGQVGACQRLMAYLERVDVATSA